MTDKSRWTQAREIERTNRGDKPNTNGGTEKARDEAIRKETAVSRNRNKRLTDQISEKKHRETKRLKKSRPEKRKAACRDNRN